MSFRPPADAILQCLPIGTELFLRAEPTNPHDSNAVQVLVDLAKFPENKAELFHALAPDRLGFQFEGLFMLGYIAGSGKKTARGGPGNVEVLLLCSNVPQAYSDLMLDGVQVKLGVAREGYHTADVTAFNPETPDWEG